jgi:hypothetical protein
MGKLYLVNRLTDLNSSDKDTIDVIISPGTSTLVIILYAEKFNVGMTIEITQVLS